MTGLSPRVRGNLIRWAAPRPTRWSIPARAGEPAHPALGQVGFTVYPRACGGTFASAGGGFSFSGLSPRVRGNRASDSSDNRYSRSIPARAGEPPGPRAYRNCPEVYPRACGGTASTKASRLLPNGLSPRVRGNLDDTKPVGKLAGSIPARAGEPILALMRAAPDSVYPRACGGTSDSLLAG